MIVALLALFAFAIPLKSYPHQQSDEPTTTAEPGTIVGGVTCPVEIGNDDIYPNADQRTRYHILLGQWQAYHDAIRFEELGQKECYILTPRSLYL